MRKKEDGYYRGSSCKYKLIAHIVLNLGIKFYMES